MIRLCATSMTSSNEQIKIEPVDFNYRDQHFTEQPIYDIPNGSSHPCQDVLVGLHRDLGSEGPDTAELTNEGEGENEGTKRHQAKAPTGRCKVCGDDASGMYFGALVCVSCKTFFLRYDGNEVNFTCKGLKCCPVTVKSRTQCKYCRYHRCLEAGMFRRVRPAQVQASEGQQLCAVCGDIGNGIHFGAITCEGCKKFFRRGLTEQCSYVCMNDAKCIINPRTRNSCRFCRYQKCLKIGMSRDAIQMGRPSKVAHESLSTQGVKRPETSNNRSRKNQSSSSSSASSEFVDRNLTGYRHTNALGSQYELSQRDFTSCQHDNLQALDLSRTASRLDTKENLVTYKRSSLDGLSENQSRRLDDGGSSETDSQPDSTVVLPESNSNALRALLERGLHNVQQKVLTDLMERIVQDFTVKIATQNAEYRASPTGSHHEGTSDQLSFTLQGFSSSYELNAASKLLSTCATLAQSKRKLSDAATTCTTTSSSLQPSMSTSESNVAKSESDSNEYESFKPKKFKASAYSSRQSASAVEANKGRPDQLKVSGDGEGKQGLKGDCGNMISNQGTTTSSSSSGVPSAEARGKFLQCDASRNCSSPSVSSSVVISDDEVKKEVEEESNTVEAASSSSTAEAPSAAVRARPEKVTVDVEKLVAVSKTYWANPILPDENVLIAERHWDVINRIIPAYDRFVHTGTNINRSLKLEFEESIKTTDDKQVLSSWIQNKVVPEYTNASVTYCKSLIGFSDFDPDDQVTIIRLGQSPSRILVAALHWFDSDRHRFRNFLSWRESYSGSGTGDLFKKKLIQYSEDLTLLELDPIEAALLNVLLIVATDYPSLKNTSIIEETRQKIIGTFTAYATAKFGTPNNRLAVLFGYMPEVRRLGLLHHQMTKTRTMTAEEVEQQLL